MEPRRNEHIIGSSASDNFKPREDFGKLMTSKIHSEIYQPLAGKSFEICLFCLPIFTAFYSSDSILLRFNRSTSCEAS